MKVAISAKDQNPEAQVDPRFGRCSYFAVVDVEQDQWGYLLNPGLSSGGGAGTYAAQELVNKNVQVVLTGSAGPNAEAVLKAAGIAIYTGVSGTLQEALALYREGHLEPAAGGTARCSRPQP